jgi:hypothetical protein
MKRVLLCCTVFAALLFLGGCKSHVSDSDGIRAGINEHLTALKTISVSSMEMNITNISIQGDQAQAQVEFRPKTGAPQGAGMQVAYSLAKQDGKWFVQTSKVIGGVIEHPGPGQNPHMNPGSPSSGTLPDLSGIVRSMPGGSLPPGHPPINPQGNTSPK